MNPLHRRGFTLTEASVVLGIIGVMTAALWLGVARMEDQRRVTAAQELLLLLTNKIRSLYSPQRTMDDGNITNALIETAGMPTQQIVPDPNDASKKILSTPWGPELNGQTSSIQTYIFPATGSAASHEPRLAIVFNNIDPSGCIHLIQTVAHQEGVGFYTLDAFADYTYPDAHVRSIATEDLPNELTGLDVDTVTAVCQTNEVGQTTQNHVSSVLFVFNLKP